MDWPAVVAATLTLLSALVVRTVVSKVCCHVLRHDRAARPVLISRRRHRHKTAGDPLAQLTAVTRAAFVRRSLPRQR